MLPGAERDGAGEGGDIDQLTVDVDAGPGTSKHAEEGRMLGEQLEDIMAIKTGVHSRGTGLDGATPEDHEEEDQELASGSTANPFAARGRRGPVGNQRSKLLAAETSTGESGRNLTPADRDVEFLGDSTENRGKDGSRGVAVIWKLFETLSNNALNGGGNLGSDSEQRCGGVVTNPLGECSDVRCFEGMSTGEHPVEENPEGEDIAPGVESFSENLLWAHVRW